MTTVVTLSCQKLALPAPPVQLSLFGHDKTCNELALAETRTHALALSGVAIGLVWWALPVSLDKPSTGIANDQCLALSDAPPAVSAPIAAYRRCSALFPRDVELKADLARAYEHAGRHQDAEAAYQQALRSDPEFAEVRLRLGQLMLRRGAREDARRQAELGLQIQPNRRALRELLREATANPASGGMP